MRKTENPVPIFQNPHLNGKTRFLEGMEKTGFLLIHGFTATTVEVSWLAEFLNEQGYPVLMPLLPGHGTTPEDLNLKKYPEWINCVEEAYKQFSALVDRVIIGGESMGAVLALYLAAVHPEIKALLLYSPALEVPGLKKSRWLRWIQPIINKRNYDDEMPWQGYTVYSVKAAFEFSKMQRVVKRKLSDIYAPMIIFHGYYDRTISPRVSNLIIDNVRSGVKKIHRMDNSGHVMLLDREFDQIAAMTIGFLKSNHIL